jgi:hypothetical protein
MKQYRRMRLRRRRDLIRLSRLALIGWLLAGVVFILPALSQGADPAGHYSVLDKAPAVVLSALAEGRSQEVLLLYDDQAIEAEASQRMASRSLASRSSRLSSNKSSTCRGISSRRP